MNNDIFQEMNRYNLRKLMLRKLKQYLVINFRFRYIK